MKTRAKVAGALVAAIAGATGGLASVDCYQGTIYQAGEYRTAAECVARGKPWKPTGAVLVAQEETLLPSMAGDFECACSTGKDCDVDKKPAPPGNTLSPGTWRGEGCLKKTCIELAGRSSWPRECPTK